MIIMKGYSSAQVGEPGAAQAVRRTQRILIADDDELIRQLNAHLLSHFGYQTETAGDGSAAWEALRAKSYDLLITDINMPNLSGVELVEKVRSAHMPLPVILMSGTMPFEGLSQQPWLHLAATLLKPFTGDELLETVRKVLRQADSAGEQIESLAAWQREPSSTPSSYNSEVSEAHTQ
jgi:DNA-binding NtrC family response regulator